jgi:hypothetical protein
MQAIEGCLTSRAFLGLLLLVSEQSEAMPLLQQDYTLGSSDFDKKF